MIPHVPPVVAAIDVGGTSTKAALVDGDRRVLHTLRWRTPRGADAVLARVAGAVAELDRRAGVPVAAVGVAMPGVVDEAAGIASYSANLGWRDFDVPTRLTAYTGRPTVLGHDVRAGAIAEAELGAARGFDNSVFVPIGTGISAAIVSAGRMLVADGFAGEIGHLVVEPDGEQCLCGGRGCLETVASAKALARRYSAISGVDVRSALDVRDRLLAGDPIAERVWARGVDALAGVLANLVATLAPEAIVIGGGLSGAGAALLDPLRERLAARLTFHRRPVVVPAALGDEAGSLGAALLALKHLRSASIRPRGARFATFGS